MTVQPTAAPVPAIWDRFEPAARLTINSTLTCNLACAHCNTESSPQRRERLTPDEVREILAVGVRRGKRHVTFSGGEVMLFPADLLAAVREATALGYSVDIETNAFWARTEAMAREKLAPFAAAGLQGICLSADAYHERYFPTQRTINAARAARSYGMLTEVNFCPSNDPVDDDIRRTLDEAGEPYISNQLLDRGRGRSLTSDAATFPVAGLPDCDSRTTTVHGTGEVYACCEIETVDSPMKSTPVFLGSIRPAVAPALSSDDERLVAAFYDPASPAYFRTLVEEEPAFRPLRDQRFVSICDFCVRALSDADRVAAVRDRLGGRP